MTKYTVCDKCKKLIEYIPITRFEGGTSYTIIECPKCGYKKETNKSYIHYGLDGKS